MQLWLRHKEGGSADSLPESQIAASSVQVLRVSASFTFMAPDEAWLQGGNGRTDKSREPMGCLGDQGAGREPFRSQREQRGTESHEQEVMQNWDITLRGPLGLRET